MCSSGRPLAAKGRRSRRSLAFFEVNGTVEAGEELRGKIPSNPENIMAALASPRRLSFEKHVAHRRALLAAGGARSLSLRSSFPRLDCALRATGLETDWLPGCGRLTAEYRLTASGSHSLPSLGTANAARKQRAQSEFVVSLSLFTLTSSHRARVFHLPSFAVEKFFNLHHSLRRRHTPLSPRQSPSLSDGRHPGRRATDQQFTLR